MCRRRLIFSSPICDCNARVIRRRIKLWTECGTHEMSWQSGFKFAEFFFCLRHCECLLLFAALGDIGGDTADRVGNSGSVVEWKLVRKVCVDAVILKNFFTLRGRFVSNTLIVRSKHVGHLFRKEIVVCFTFNLLFGNGKLFVT